MARRAFADAVREKAQAEATAAEPNESRTPSLSVNLMCQAGYRGFDAHYDVGAGTFSGTNSLAIPVFSGTSACPRTGTRWTKKTEAIAMSNPYRIAD